MYTNGHYICLINKGKYKTSKSKFLAKALFFNIKEKIQNKTSLHIRKKSVLEWYPDQTLTAQRLQYLHNYPGMLVDLF